jgi:hypothetical protein
MKLYKKKYFTNKLFILVLILGVTLRFLISIKGYSIDVEHWRINAYIISLNLPIYGFGGNNYGPVWIHILHILDKIPLINLGDEILNLRYKILFFLTFVDIFIFLIAYKIHNLKIASIFFLNPISIFITGYHGQMENLAILIGLLSILVFLKYKNKLKNLFLTVLIGISLSIKHILIFFPIWIFLKEKKLKLKIFYVLFPYFIFVLAFVPFDPTLKIAFQELNHSSFNNYPFWSIFTPSFLGNYLGYKTLFIITLLLMGLFFQDKKLLDLYYLYLISFVVFASAISNQYLVIPVLAIAFFWNRFFLLYTISASIFYLLDDVALNIQFVQELFNWTRNHTDKGYKVIIIFLTLGLLQEIFTKKKFDRFFIKIFNYFKKKIYIQFKFK